VTPREDFLQALSRQLADDGKLIEAGWVALQMQAIPPSAPAVQIKEMRMAFMAGAQHLFASIVSIMDDDREPTDADMRRMDLISAELEAFGEELKRDGRFAMSGTRW
jgi:hypothetical protein